VSRQRAGNSKRRILYRWILFGATIAAVAWFISRNTRLITSFDFEFNWLYLLLAFCSVLAAFLARFGAWLRLSSWYGLAAPFTAAGRAYFLSMLARYIPGKIGLALMRVETYPNHQPSRVIMATGIELVSALAAAFLLAFVGLMSISAYVPSALWWLSLFGVALLLTALSPPVLTKIANIVFRLTGRMPIEQIAPFGKSIAFAALYTIPGLLHGLGLFLVLNSLSPVPATHYLAITGAYYAASLTGLVAFFAPGGLGVREGVLFLVLPLLVPKESAIIAAVAIRLVTIVAEVALAGTFTLAARVTHKNGMSRT
jgi:uncharacterized membrane protein YbhN (UPF0104 family)